MLLNTCFQKYLVESINNMTLPLLERQLPRSISYMRAEIAQAGLFVTFVHIL